MADFSIPIQGISRASADFDRAASNIAHSAVPMQKADAAVNNVSIKKDTVDLSTSMVDLLQAKNDYAANTKTFRVFDEMNRNVVDMIG
jgi:flagellar hook protein FlgE